jgi:hypothetical protein
MPENPRWPSYARCRLCHHYETTSIHSDKDHELVHDFIRAAPGEIPDGFKNPEAIERDVKAHR